MYICIENPGTFYEEYFTVFGAGTKRNSSNKNLLGKFQSGAKMAVGVCLRNKLNPIVCISNLKLKYTVKNKNIGECVYVEYSGKDDSGISRTATKDLNFVLDYGSLDWTAIEMALREFVSNAIDECIINNLDPYWNVNITIEKEPRAKIGHTRVFVPVNSKVLAFKENIGKWFLHLADPDMSIVSQTILPKANRNLSNSQRACIYRKGGFVRECGDKDSLFDWNINDLPIDESRNSDDWNVRSCIGKLIADAPPEVLAKIMLTYVNEGNSKFEHSIAYNLYDNCLSISQKNKRKENWQQAFKLAFGEDAVACNEESNLGAIQKKGYSTIILPSAYLEAARTYEVRSSSTVLSDTENRGIEKLPASQQLIIQATKICRKLEQLGFTNGIHPPTFYEFHNQMSSGSLRVGHYDPDEKSVLINTCLGPNFDGQESYTTIIEELGHHYTNGALDNSRDFQDYAFSLAAKCLMEMNK